MSVSLLITESKQTRLKRLILGSRRKIINLDYRLDRLDNLDRLYGPNRLDRLDRTRGLGPVGWDWDHFIAIFLIGNKSKFNQV